ncbi:hypothetical protein CHUAL_007830 [Chamberlinius hualienensis]
MSMDVCLSWPSHGKVLSDSVWKFYQENYKTDLDLSLSGHYVKVHHLIISAFCPLIKQLTNDKFIRGESEVIEKEDVEHLVEFMYRGKVNVSQERLPSLLKGAEVLGFRALVDVIKKYIDIQTKYDSLKRQGKLTSKKAVEKLNSMTEMSEDDQSAVKEKEADETNNSSDVQFQDFNKDRRNYRRTLDYNAFDSTSLQHICKHCNEGFEVFDDYVNHVRQHENPELVHKCPHCNYKARLKFGLTQHVVAKHQMDMRGKKLEKNISCPLCSFTCFANFQLKNHQITVHTNRRKKCDQCHFSTTSRAGLNKHIRIVHQNERPFMCDTCGSRFKTFQAFRNHVSTHVGKKRICDVCGANLSINAFHAHMKTHTQTRPFPCHICSFAARKRYNLKVHLKNVHKFAEEQIQLFLSQDVNQEEEKLSEQLNVAIIEMNSDFEFQNLT